MKHAFFPRCTSILFLLGMAFLVRPAQANNITLPGNNIDYNASYIYIRYDGTNGANPTLPCFGSRVTDANVIGKSLSDVGISHVDEIISILSGDAMACFQKAGTYKIQFELVDTAGNIAIFPDAVNPYQITVLPGNPSLEPGVHPGLDVNGDGNLDPGIDANGDGDFTDSGDTLPDVAPGTPINTTSIGKIVIDGDGDPTTSNPLLDNDNANDCDIPANGSATCTIEIVFRDQFGNVVTQYDSVDDIQVFFAPDNNGAIEIDGLLDPLSSNTEVTANNAFDNDGASGVSVDGSVATFLENVLAGDGTPASEETLQTLLDNPATQINLRKGGSDGFFEFVIRSHAPTIKFLDASDPAQGAGVSRQQLLFDMQLARLDSNGNIILGDWIDLRGSGFFINEDFAFRPLASAIPKIEPANVVFDTVLPNPGGIRTIVSNTAPLASLPDLVFYTPFDEYLLKEMYDGDADPLVVDLEERNFLQPFDAASVDFPVTTNPHKILTNSDGEGAFFVSAVTGVGTTTSSGVGLGSQVQYDNGNGETLRHISHVSLTDSSDSSYDPELDPTDVSYIPTKACPAGGDYVECYAFNPSGSLRFIGADIEGAVLANRDQVTIYTSDVTGEEQGQRTAYAGDVNNDAIRDDLLQQVQRAITSPASELGTEGGLTSFSDVSTRFGLNDVVVVRGNVHIVAGDTVPTGQKTMIIVDGNLSIEENLTYANVEDSFGVILYNTSQNRGTNQAPVTGNMFVHQDVKQLAGNFYLDGSLVSVESSQYDNDLKIAAAGSTVNDIVYSNQPYQLVLQGVLWSNNTLGGAYEDETNPGVYRTPWNAAELDREKAKLFDLHFLRRYSGSGLAAECADSTEITGCDVNTNATVIRLDGKIGAERTAPPVFKSVVNLIR